MGTRTPAQIRSHHQKCELKRLKEQEAKMLATVAAIPKNNKTTNVQTASSYSSTNNQRDLANLYESNMSPNNVEIAPEEDPILDDEVLLNESDLESPRKKQKLTYHS